MLPCEKRGFIINITSLSLLLLSSLSVTHSAITCDSTAGENFTGNSFKHLMVKRDPGSQVTWILFLDLTLTYGMASLHLFIPPKYTEKNGIYKVLSHEHCSSTLREGISSAREPSCPVTLSSGWWNQGI